MIPQPLDAVLLVPLVGDAVEFALQGDAPVEGRLEHPHVPRLGQSRLHGLDGAEIGAVVYRRKGQEILHPLHSPLVELVHPVVPLGQHRLVAHPFDLGDIRQHRALALGQTGEEPLDARPIIGDVLSGCFLPVAGAAVAVAKDGVVGRAHPLHLAGGQQAALRHLIQFEF